MGARFEANSYGFRPCRGAGDAIAKIHSHVRGLNRPWIFEGDFKSCFDTLNHDFILDKIKYFPAYKTIERWLEAGYLDKGVFHETRVVLHKEVLYHHYWPTLRYMEWKKP